VGFPRDLTLAFPPCNRSRIEEERVADAFMRLDTDDSGYISKQNLRAFLGTQGTSERIDQLIKESDTDNDGRSKFFWNLKPMPFVLPFTYPFLTSHCVGRSFVPRILGHVPQRYEQACQAVDRSPGNDESPAR
jgi:hypothetical protein